MCGFQSRIQKSNAEVATLVLADSVRSKIILNCSEKRLKYIANIFKLFYTARLSVVRFIYLKGSQHESPKLGGHFSSFIYQIWRNEDLDNATTKKHFSFQIVADTHSLETRGSHSKANNLSLDDKLELTHSLLMLRTNVSQVWLRLLKHVLQMP